MEEIIEKIHKRTLTLLQSESFEYFASGLLKEVIIKEFNLPDKFDDFVLWFNNIIHEYTTFNKNIPVRKEEIRKNIRELHQKLNIELELIKRADEKNTQIEKSLKELNLSLIRLKDELLNIENEIKIAQLTDPLTNLQTLVDVKEDLIKKINSTAHEEEDFKKILADLPNNAYTNKESLEKELKILEEDPIHDIREISLRTDLVPDICYYLYHIKDKHLLSEALKIDARNYRINSAINFNTIYQAYNGSEWRKIISEVFNKMPNFSLSYNINERNRADIEIDSFSFWPSFWLCIRNAISSNLPSLNTADGKIFLWLTNSIYTEIKIWKHDLDANFIGVYHNEKSIWNSTNIISGYTNSGYFIPYGLFIVAKNYSIEFRLHQSALLQSTPPLDLFANEQMATAKKVYEESED